MKLGLFTKTLIIAFLLCSVIFPTTGWTQVGSANDIASPNEEDSGNFGYAVSGVPDVNGDAKGDFLVGARFEDGGATDAGRVYIFDGVTQSLLRTLQSPYPEGNNSNAFGRSIAGISDVNGDGRGDVIVGAHAEDAGGITNSGRVYIFHGATGAVLRTLESPNSQAYGFFGYSVSAIPDVNGDGRADVLIGADSEFVSLGTYGHAYIFDGATGDLLRTLISPNPGGGGTYGGHFGLAVSGISDVDGDGHGDVVIGAEKEDGGGLTSTGRAYVFSGVTGALLWTLQSPNSVASGLFGHSVSGVSDVDGDGHGDIIVSAGNELTTSIDGRVYVFSGATGALLRTLITPTFIPVGEFGCSVAGVADLDGDGRGDIIVGARSEGGVNSPGRVHLFSGATGSLTQTLVSPNAMDSGRFGDSVAGVSDANSDGRGEVLVGATYENPGVSPNRAGRAYLFLSQNSTPTPALGLSPTTLQPSCLQGSNPPSAAIHVSNTGGGTLQYTISVDAVWLSVIPSSGDSVGEVDDITVSYNTSGLSAGAYSATITISDPAAVNDPQTVPVSLTVNPPVPSISISPLTLSPATIAGQNASNDSFQVCNGGGGTLNYSISDNAAWLSVSPASGTSTGEIDAITVIYDTLALPAGNYNATITVSDPAASNTPRTMDVDLTVNPPGPLIAINPSALAPVSVTGTNAPNDAFNVSNAGGGTLNYTISDNAVWLSVSPFSGSSTGESDAISVLYDTSGLTAAVYSATITITAPGATNTPRTLPVTLTVNPPPPTIGCTPASFSPSVTQGGNAPGQTLFVYNSGGGTLNYSISDNASWLTATPTSGSSTGELDAIAIQSNSSGLTAGTYQATVTISDPAATNTPSQVSVNLTVLPPPPSIGLSVTSLSRTVTQGQNAASQTFQISNSGGGTLNYSLDDNVQWLSVSPTNGSVLGGSQTMTITYATTGLSAGSHIGTITVTAPGAVPSSKSITVNLTVYPIAVQIAVSPDSLSRTTAQGLSPQSQSFTVRNAGSGALVYSVTVNQPSWLHVSPTSGVSTGPSDTITVSYTAAGLAVGTHSATITVSGSGATPQTIPVTVTVTPPAPTLDVTYPDGGEIMVKGQDYHIKWNSPNYSGNVRVHVWKGGRYYETLAATTPGGTGANGLIFNPPLNWPSGNDYKIGISTLGNSASNFSQGYFAIVDSPINPVLLVRGFSPNGLQDSNYWLTQKQYLVNHLGYSSRDDFWDTAYDPDSNQYIVDGRLSREVNAVRVKTFIESKISQRKITQPNVKFDVIAHSFGGQIFNQAFMELSSDARNRLNKLILIDPATQGANLADRAVEARLIRGSRSLIHDQIAPNLDIMWPSLDDLQTKASITFSGSSMINMVGGWAAKGGFYIVSSEMANPYNVWRNGIPYGQKINNLQLILFLGADFLGSNDGILSRASQEYYPIGYPPFQIQRFTIGNGYPQDHSQVLANAYSPSGYHNPLVDQWLGYWLTGIAKPSAPGMNAAPISSIKLANAEVSTSNYENILNESIKLQQNESSTVIVPIESSGEFAEMDMEWLSPNDYDISLRRPDGQTITSSTLDLYPDVTYAQNDTATSETILHSRRFTINQPLSGEWRMLLKGSHVDGTSESLSVMAGVSSPLSVTWNPLDKAFVGSSTEISLKLSFDDTPVTGAVFSATAYQDGATSFTFQLFDDGSHGDGAANDGVYGAMLDPFNTQGEVFVVVQVTGTDPNGYAFQRLSNCSFYVIPASATISGPLTYDLADSDADGTSETVRLHVAVDVLTTGTYNLGVELRNAERDSVLVGGGVLTNAAVGAASADIAVDLSHLPLGFSEPSLQVANLRIYATAPGFVLCSELSDPGLSIPTLSRFPASGSLQVTITSQASVAAGAQWRRVGTTAWFDSGTSEQNIPTGTINIEFKPIAEWSQPANQQVTVQNGQTTSFSVTYIKKTGVESRRWLIYE